MSRGQEMTCDICGREFPGERAIIVSWQGKVFCSEKCKRVWRYGDE